MRLWCCRWWTMIVSASWHRILTHAFALSGDQNCCGVSYLQKKFGGEVCYREAVISKGCSNQLRPLDESQDRGNFLIDGALLHRSGEEKPHIWMPSTTATDGVSLSLSVMEVVENFRLEAKVVGITSDGGVNLRICMEAMESKYTNDSIFSPPKPLFTMECLVHILSGAYKAGVQ